MADENNNFNNPNEQSGQYYDPQQQNTQNGQYYSAPQDNGQQYYQAPPQGYNNQFNYQMPPQEEKANVGLAILSFLIPIVGLVLYLTQKNEKPKTAKACGKAALACVIISFIFGIISGVASFFLASKAMEEAPDASYYENYEDYEDLFNSYLEDGDVSEPAA